MFLQRGLLQLQLDRDIYTDTTDTLSSQIADLIFKHERMKTIKADTYNLAQEIRTLGFKKARLEGKAMRISKHLRGGNP